jgi:hypothetical protein
VEVDKMGVKHVKYTQTGKDADLIGIIKSMLHEFHMSFLMEKAVDSVLYRANELGLGHKVKLEARRIEEVMGLVKQRVDEIYQLAQEKGYEDVVEAIERPEHLLQRSRYS